MPGFVNSHTHAAMTCFRGIADDLELMDWLNNYIFPAEAKNVNKELAYWGSLLAAAEMIKSGTTTFCDMYIFEDETAHAAKTPVCAVSSAKCSLIFLRQTLKLRKKVLLTPACLSKNGPMIR